MVPREVPDIAASQSDVFTRNQAYVEGWSRRQTRRRLEVGRWRIVAGKGLCGRDVSIGAWQLASATLLTWPGAIVSHEVAGVLHGLPVPLGVVGTAIVDPGRKLGAAGLRAHRCRLRPEEIGTVGRMPVTTFARTAIDLLGAGNWDQSRSLWSWLAARQLMTLEDLDKAIRDRAWWDGTTQLRRLAAASATGSASAGEDRLHDLLRGARIEGWRANVPVHQDGRFIAIVDLLFERERIVIEFDGYRTHSDRDAFQRDRTRQNRLITAGFRVLRFTWADVTSRPDYVTETIARALKG
jgi:very-short-patch-repair endonuclease